MCINEYAILLLGSFMPCTIWFRLCFFSFFHIFFLPFMFYLFWFLFRLITIGRVVVVRSHSWVVPLMYYCPGVSGWLMGRGRQCKQPVILCESQRLYLKTHARCPRMLWRNLVCKWNMSAWCQHVVRCEDTDKPLLRPLPLCCLTSLWALARIFEVSAYSAAGGQCLHAVQHAQETCGPWRKMYPYLLPQPSRKKLY